MNRTIYVCLALAGPLPFLAGKLVERQRTPFIATARDALTAHELLTKLAPP